MVPQRATVCLEHHEKLGCLTNQVTPVCWVPPTTRCGTWHSQEPVTCGTPWVTGYLVATFHEYNAPATRCPGNAVKHFNDIRPAIIDIAPCLAH
jgi:hypothetical protein